MTHAQSWLDHDRRVLPYLWSHRILNLSERLLGIVLAAYLILAARGIHLEWWLQTYCDYPLLLWLAYFGILSVAWKLLALPFDFAHYRLERSYNLSKQKSLAWLWDQAKALLVGAVLGGGVLSALHAIVGYFPGNWWIVFFVFLFFFSIVLTQLAPVFLIPIFYRLQPMEQGSLKERLFRLCRKFNIAVKEVYQIGLSEKTEKGNAAFVGLGRTKRILIGDTLTKHHTEEEIEAVFAHELGHQVHQDLWKGIFFGAVVLFACFYLAQKMMPWILPRFGTSIDRPFGMFLFFVLFSILQVPTGWFGLVFTRHREKCADEFAKKLGVGRSLANSLEKLTIQNFSIFKPHPLMEFFTYSHPAPWRRITRLQQA